MTVHREYEANGEICMKVPIPPGIMRQNAIKMHEDPDFNWEYDGKCEEYAWNADLDWRSEGNRGNIAVYCARPAPRPKIMLFTARARPLGQK